MVAIDPLAELLLVVVFPGEARKDASMARLILVPVGVTTVVRVGVSGEWRAGRSTGTTVAEPGFVQYP
jgi:hypothetical protein